jgi:NTP pyrophosphatase (non-canonical NTP hydrolase)
MAKRTKSSEAEQRVAEAVARTRFTEAVRAERGRQIEKWGHGNPGFSTMVAVLTEEVGEVARAVLDGDEANLVDELEQVGAVACRIYEQVKRGDQLGAKNGKHSKVLTRRQERAADLEKLTEALDSAARFFLGKGKQPKPEDFAVATLAARRLRGAL